MPNACIGVDVIVGYPSESEEDFLETYNYLNNLDVSYFHVFTYSERANTVAIRKEEVVPMEVRRERSKMLQILSEKKKRAFYESQLNKDFSVLFEAQENQGEMFGFTENYLKIKTTFNKDWINQIKQVKPLKVNTDGTIFAEVLNEELVPLEAI
jgi:threonylcarbamoyladenosine tRNA methylthiotransferase MtaB